MPVALEVTVDGVKELQARLARVNPRKNDAWMRRALIEAALMVQKIAAEEMIIRGGRIGKGRKKTDAPADPVRLTSRTGRLRGSIKVDRGGLPWSISIGSDVAYAAIHELGGPIRGGTMPKRPYLKPALDKASKQFSSIFQKHLNAEIAKS